MASVHHCFIRLQGDNSCLAAICLPAWWGLATAEDKSWMKRLLERLWQGDYLLADFPSTETLAFAADHHLFVSVANYPRHVLRRLYHEKDASGYIVTFKLGLITLHSQEKMGQLSL